MQWRIGLLWLLVLGGVLLTVDEPLSRLPMLAIATALFVVVFRLWDDLADLDHDRAYHPGRCLTRAQDLRPYHIAQWLLIAGLAALLLQWFDHRRALAFPCLVVAFLLMYLVTARRPAMRPLRTSIVLTKYPACVLLLADAPGGYIAPLAALGVYLPPLLDEVRGNGTAVVFPSAVLAGLAVLGWLAQVIWDWPWTT